MPTQLIPNPDLSRHPGRPRAHVRVRPRRAAAEHRARTPRSSGRGASRPTAATCSPPTTAASRRRRSSARARSGTWSTTAADGITRSTSTSRKDRSSPATAARPNVPPWEKGRKDVYRLRPGGSITITHAVPRLGRHVHGALPQHDARGQRDAAALGDQRRRGRRSCGRCRRRCRHRRASSSRIRTICRRHR